MTNTSVIGIRLNEDDEAILDLVSQKTGMSRSEVVRQLIKKAVNDEKCLQIITTNSYVEKAYKRSLGRTSHNVQIVNEGEKKDAEPYQHPAGCPQPTSKEILQLIPHSQVDDMTEAECQHELWTSYRSETDPHLKQMYFGMWAQGATKEQLAKAAERLPIARKWLEEHK